MEFFDPNSLCVSLVSSFPLFLYTTPLNGHINNMVSNDMIITQGPFGYVSNVAILMKVKYKYFMNIFL